ncbi:MAG: retropepsin-like domain-containing protein, partial [Planctomycetales bacterium]|nr:retropepsin-like domain-containing protein [Planctomycetales bacterium]
MPGRKQVCRIPRGRATAYRCRAIGIFEVLEPRLPLSASSINDRPYIDVGPSDNVAWDQPRVTVQLLTQDFPDGSEPPQDIIVGPSTFNGWLLDTGANTTLGFQTAVTDMSQFAPVYQTDGKFNELGVGGVELFDVSIPYRFDFAGSTTYERNKLLESRIISNPDRDVSIFGPWGIVGMPAMTERITTVDFTPWTNVQGFDLFMQTDFPAELPDPLGPRFTLPVDNRVRFSPEGSVVSGPGIPMWADLPFLTGELKNNESLTSGNFLFDTGAQVSILSQQLAFDLGLDSNNDGVLNSLDANFARTETIGGIAGQTTVPVFLIDEVHIPTEEGADLVWTDLQWVILDIVEGIDGVFGFDNLTSGWIEAFGVDGQSGYILQSHFDFRNWEATGQGKIYFDFNETLFTLVDPLGPGAIITESGGSTTVTEDGSVADTYEIRLSQRPTADVTVSFVGGNNQVGAVDDANPNSHFVVFTPQDWNVPKKVRAVATNDSVQEGYHRAFLRHVSSSTDANYDGVGMPRVSVGIVDDDFAGMMIIPTDGDTVVTEGGEPDYYDIVLTTAPVSEVYILINHIAGQVTAVSDADGSGALIFTPDNWYVPQTVRVTAIDDTIEEPLLPAYISHTIGSVDESYQQAFALQERAFVRDN